MQLQVVNLTFSLINDLHSPKINVLERLDIKFQQAKLTTCDVKLRYQPLQLVYVSGITDEKLLSTSFINFLCLVTNESAKLRAVRALVTYALPCPTCFRASCPTCSGDSRVSCPTCFHASGTPYRSRSTLNHYHMQPFHKSYQPPRSINLC